MRARVTAGAVLLCVLTRGALALDPQKSLTQYSRTVWSQEHGLPQDTIRAIAQTADGYLWLGTDEGLARFDGYEFVVFNKDSGDLPANSITALAAARGRGVVDRHVQRPDVLSRQTVSHLHHQAGAAGQCHHRALSRTTRGRCGLWRACISAGIENGKFTNLAPGPDLPVTAVRAIREDWRGDLWVGGFQRRGQAGGREVLAGDGCRGPRWQHRHQHAAGPAATISGWAAPWC